MRNAYHKEGDEFMIATSKLRGVIAERGLSQKKVAEHLGIGANTFYAKMKKGVFDSDEIASMITFLEIEQPLNIFFIENST